ASNWFAQRPLRRPARVAAVRPLAVRRRGGGVRPARLPLEEITMGNKFSERLFKHLLNVRGWDKLTANSMRETAAEVEDMIEREEKDRGAPEGGNDKGTTPGADAKVAPRFDANVEHRDDVVERLRLRGLDTAGLEFQ